MLQIHSNWVLGKPLRVKTLFHISGIKTQCVINGSKLIFRISNIAGGTGTGQNIGTRNDEFYISGTIVYK